MRAFKTISWIGFVGASAIIAVACDSAIDYEKPTPDAGFDSSVTDTGADAVTTDTGTDAFDARPDVTVDAGPDVVDAGRDVGPDVVDAGRDVGPDVVDAGRDVGPDVIDAGPPNYSAEITAFLKNNVLAVCARYKAACGTPVTWQQAKCEGAIPEGYGALYEDLVKTPLALSAGRLNYDPAKAAVCVAAIGTMEFPVRSAANHKSILDACSAVVTGRQAIGAACNAPIECAVGGTCKAGVCVPEGAAGVACDLWPVGSSAVRSNSCSNHGIGETGLFCGSLNGAPATCQELLPAGAGCINDHVCASDLCDVNGSCTVAYDDVAAQDPCGYLTTP